MRQTNAQLELHHLVPKGVNTVALREITEQLEIIKAQKNDWFYTRCHIKDKVCSLAIDKGCEVNLASTVLVEKLNLPTIDHLRPYKLQSDSGDIWITKHTLVPFRIGQYVDEVLCDVVPIQVTHVLLGQWWMFNREVKYDGYTNKYSFTFNGRRTRLVSLNSKQLCIDLAYMKSEHERYSMKKELEERIVTEEVKFEGVEKEKEVENNEGKKSATEHEKEIKNSKSKLIVRKDVRSYVFSNDLDSTLFSVSTFMQVKQGKIELILACSMPKSIGEYQTFHGVCTLSVVSLCHPLMFNVNHEPDLLVGRNNEVSKGVSTLETCYKFPSYFVGDNPFLIGPNSDSLQPDFILQFEGSKATYLDLVPFVQDRPYPQQLAMNFVTLHNHVRDFSNLIEHHYEDPYLVNVNGKLSSDFIPTNANRVIYCVGPNSTIHDTMLIRELWSG